MQNKRQIAFTLPEKVIDKIAESAECLGLTKGKFMEFFILSQADHFVNSMQKMVNQEIGEDELKSRRANEVANSSEDELAVPKYY